MSADLLRRAAKVLRDPCVCDWPDGVPAALADLLEAHIPLFAGLDPAPDHEVLMVARAILREPEATP